MSLPRPILPYQVVSALDVADMNEMMAVINLHEIAWKYDPFTKIYALKYLLGFETKPPLKYTEELGEAIDESVQEWFAAIQIGETAWTL
jgi:hypothetical protein